MKTFGQLKTEVLRYFDLASEPSTSADVELVSAAINTANQHRAAEERWKFMLSPVYTLLVVAGQQEYILPHPSMAKLFYLFSTTNSRWAYSTPLREIPNRDISFQDNNRGDSVFFDIQNSASPVKAQPLTADTLVVTSTESEAVSVGLYVEGEDADGAEINETILSTATSTQEFAKISYIAKTEDFTGTMTLATTGGVELLVLTADEAGRDYPVLKFYNIPSGNETFQYRFFRKPRVMSRDLDRPDIPFPMCSVLVYDALLDLATYNELDSESVNIWRDKQQMFVQDLYLEKLEGDTVPGIGITITSGAF